MIRQSCTSWTTTSAEDRSLSYLHYYTSTLVLFSHTTLNTTAEISGENWPQIVVYQKAFLHMWDPTLLKESGSSKFPGASKLFFSSRPLFVPFLSRPFPSLCFAITYYPGYCRDHLPYIHHLPPFSTRCQYIFVGQPCRPRSPASQYSGDSCRKFRNFP